MALLSRTDEQRIARAPFTLAIGGDEREVRPLPHRKATEWRKAFNDAVGKFGGIKLELTDADGKLSMEMVAKTVETVAVTIPDVLADMVFLYVRLADPSVSRDWFDDTATTQEITDALLRLVEVEFPFLRKFGGLMSGADLGLSSATSSKSP